MKKKLLLATNVFPYNGGEAAFIIPELKRLKEEYDITVISHAGTEQSQAGYVKEDILEGLRIVHFPYPVITTADKVKAMFSYLLSGDGRREIREIFHAKCNVVQRLYQSLSFYAQALVDQREIVKSQVIPSEEPVIYYSFWNTYYCYSMVREQRKHKNVKIVSRLHGFDLYHERVPGGRQPFKHQMEDGVKGLIFLGDFARNYYREKVGADNMPAEKLHVCPLGIEHAGKRMPLGQAQTLHLLSCSDVISLKRIDCIVDGLACIDQGKICWTHIGDGGEFEKIKVYAAEKLEGKDNISYRLKGHMAHSQVVHYYETEQVDCFITTSSTEGMPVSIMEAMSYGIPVIATAVGGIPEMIRGNGILLSENATGEETAKAVMKILQMDDDAVEQMKDNSYRLWEEKFDINESIAALSDILEQAGSLE